VLDGLFIPYSDYYIIVTEIFTSKLELNTNILIQVLFCGRYSKGNYQFLLAGITSAFHNNKYWYSLNGSRYS
jgi:hypothetical protein